MGVTQINSQKIKDGSVDTADLKDASVTLAKLAALTTKGDLLGFSTTHVRQPSGTNNSLLMTTTGTATGLTWVQPNDTSLTFNSGVSVNLATNGGLQTSTGVLVRGFRTVSTDPASPSDGDTWYNTTAAGPRAYVQSTVIGLGGLFYGSTTDSTSVSNTNAETIFDTKILVHNNLFTTGRAIRVRCYGLYSVVAATAPTLTFRLKVGNSNIITTPTLTTPTGASNQAYMLEAIIYTRTGGSTAAIRAGGTVSIATNALVPLRSGAPSFDATLSQTIQVSVQWGTAATGNTINTELFTVEALN